MTCVPRGGTKCTSDADFTNSSAVVVSSGALRFHPIGTVFILKEGYLKDTKALLHSYSSSEPLVSGPSRLKPVSKRQM